MTNEQVTSAADIDVTEIGHAEYHRVLDLLKNRESELEAIKLKYNDTEAKYDELLSEHEDLLRRFSDSTQDAPLLDRTQSDAAGGPDSALTQYVTRKQKEIETVLREGNTDSARAIRDSNRQRDIENIVSDIRSALKAVPQDYTTSDSFLNASEVGNTLGTSVLMQKHENLHALVRLIVSLGSFAPGGELIPHVPARCIPLKSIQDSVQNVMNLQTARSEFQRALDDAMYQYDHVTTYTERVNALQSTIQMIDEQETNHDTAVQPMKDLCFQMIESIAEARHVETETTENIALISLRFERVKDDITRRTQSLEKDVTLREQVMQQEKSRITDLTQQIQSALQQLSDIFAWLTKEAVQHRELRNEVANYYALNEALVTCREHDEERMKSIREGAKTSTMLCCKVHEMIQREIDLCEELRRDQMSTLEKARKVTQERLYSTCQQQFSELRERVAEQRAALRKEQATLASAKRLVQTDIFPEQLGRQMQEEVVERSEKSVHTLRNAIRSTENEIGKVKDLLVSAGITDFCSLDRDGKGSNFLEEYDAQCFHHEVNEKLNEATEKLKIASDHICQVADKEDVTMDAVLRWMQEGTVALVDVRTFYTTKCTSYSMKRLNITDDDVRSSCITKLKRYRRLISDAFNDIFMVNSASVHDLEGAVAGVIQQCDDVLTLISTSGYSRAPGGTTRPSQDSFGLHDATSAGEIPSHTYRNLISTSFETPEKAYISSTSNNNNNNNIINDNGGYGSQVPPLALEYTTTRADLNQNRTKNISQVSNSTKDTLGTFEAIVIGKASSKLMISHHGRRVRKGIQNMEVSDSTALGVVGYSRGKHQWRVRLRMACDKLMIGVADGSIPVEGYCNSLRYKNCFYLHVGSGTLWSPLMNMQRVPYVNESRLFVPGTELIVQLDIENGEISFGRDDTMFPAAFQGIQLAPGEKLFPSFEVYSNGCEFELIE